MLRGAWRALLAWLALPGFALLGFALLGFALLGACERRPPLEFLRLEDFAQGGAQEVRLDEELTLHFDDELDPASVHRESVAVRGANGRAVAGRFEVDGRQLRFMPELPRGLDLSDGGLRPGEWVTVELSGFPTLGGLRSRAGAPLVAPHEAGFRVVEQDAEGLFLDASQGAPAPLELERRTLEPNEPLRLVAGEALNPRSIDSAAFLLVSRVGAALEGAIKGAGEGAGAGPLEGRPGSVADPRQQRLDPAGGLERIRLRATLTVNRPDLAVIELRALVGDLDSAPRFLEPGEYYLAVPAPEHGPRDLSGRPLLAGWGLDGSGSARIEVTAGSDPSTTGRQSFDFLDPALRSERSHARAVGAAHWEYGGSVRVRLPRAVGDGSAGEVVAGSGAASQEGLRGALVQATRLEVPASVELELSGDPGLVRLAAQAELELAGSVRRRTLVGPRARRAEETNGAWRRRVQMGPEGALPELDLERDESLSQWLARADAEGLDATVLVAGGDLRITGELDVDGPLVLVAGGRVRITGRVEASEIWWTQPGNGLAQPPPAVLPLAIDEPRLNPLREAQSWKVSSEPIDPPREFARWEPAQVYGSFGIGRYVVRYAQHGSEPFAGFGAGPAAVPLADSPWLQDPLLLEDATPLVFEIELRVGAGSGELWDPPSVDRIELTWKRAPQ